MFVRAACEAYFLVRTQTAYVITRAETAAYGGWRKESEDGRYWMDGSPEEDESRSAEEDESRTEEVGMKRLVFSVPR